MHIPQMIPIHASLELLSKYNQPGPRYTSYPPATHFSDHISANHRFEGERAPLSLYFHLPFCSTQCLYCGCTNIVTGDQSRSATYLNYLEKEVELRLPFIHNDSEVVQVQLGGGTPTFLLPEEIERLGQLIRSSFSSAKEVEAGVEIDPRSLSREKVQALRAAGFNRASLGIQDTNPQVQRAIARIQPMEMIAEKAQWLRESGFSSVNVDLIYGLPHQSVDSFSRTLDEVLTLSPDRLAVYSYAHIPWIKSFQKSFEEHLPNAEQKLKLLQLTIDKLTTSGYVYIGMDHFAKPDDAMAIALQNGTLQRNFQGYSTHKGTELHGFGLSAISHACGWYFQNRKELETYYAGLDANELPIMRGYAMTAEDQIRYCVIMHIMCDRFVDFESVSKEIGVDFKTHFKTELDSLHDLELDGLVAREKHGLIVTPLGRLFLRNIAMRFDAYLQAEQRQGRYSQTV